MSQTACERGLSPQSARKPLALAHPITCANRGNRNRPLRFTASIASNSLLSFTFRVADLKTDW